MVARPNPRKGFVMDAMIQINGPYDGKFIAQFITADGRSLSILVPEAQAEVLRDIQELMPYGVAVRDVVKDRVERPSKLVS
jgi:hypothetical protein